MTRASAAEITGARILRIFGASSPRIAALMGRSRTWVQYWTSLRVRETILDWGRANSPRRMDAMRRYFDGRDDLDRRCGNLIERAPVAPEDAHYRRKLQRIAREEAAANQLELA